MADAPLDVASLQQEVRFYRTHCWSSSTTRAYDTHRRSYVSFCNRLNVAPVPADTTLLCMYAAYLARRLKYQSIKQYLNIVRILHLEWGLPNPLLQNFHLSSTLQGIRRHLEDAATRKAPITPALLLQLQSRLDLSNPADTVIWAGALLMFFTLLRRSNVMPPSATGFDSARHLRRCDITFTPEGALIRVRWTKTIQFRERELRIPLCRLRDHPLCPTTALFLALSHSPGAPASGPALTFPKGRSYRVLTPSMFIDRVRAALGDVCDSQTLAGHSFRRGGACWAYTAGVPIDTIRQLGDWKSNAYTRYTLCDLHLLRRAEERMCESLPCS